MIKIEYCTGVYRRITAEDILIGTVFVGKIGSTSGLFVKSFAGIINLASPNETWERGANPEVKDYKEVGITIKVYDK